MRIRLHVLGGIAFSITALEQHGADRVVKVEQQVPGLVQSRCGILEIDVVGDCAVQYVVVTTESSAGPIASCGITDGHGRAVHD